MPGDAFEYAVIRVVPRVDREEFLNAGVILFCRTRRFLEARIALDASRLTAFAPWANLAEVREHLAAIPVICAGGPDAGPLGTLSQAERFHWLVAPRSTVIQPSPVHGGRAEEPATALDRLLAMLVLPPAD
jgi:hypothetical protein